MSDSITEPESGVDDVLPYDAPGAGLMTSVVKDGDYYLINGRKRFINNAHTTKLDLADMFMEIEAARAFLWYAVWRLDNRDTVPFDIKYGTMASTLCHEMAVKVSVKTLPMWGGSGIQREVPIQKYLRDAASFLHADGGVHVKRIWAAQAM